ncbi:MAG: hypothetical protein K5787_08155 [Lentisphaeria bacterium]|nr:hypothetical protein [Lentisphaeria bacterium]
MPIDWFESISKTPSPWLPSLESTAPQILLSSSVTVARNIHGLAFPPFHGKIEDASEAQLLAFHALKNLPVFMNAAVYNTKELTPSQKRLLVRRGLASEEFLAAADYRAILITPDESAIARINDQNHIEILLQRKGNCPRQLVGHAMSLMKQLDDSLDFAKDPVFGYLCTNFDQIGNGMFIQLHTHLPAIVLHGYGANAVSAAEELHLQIENDQMAQQKHDALIFKLHTRMATSPNPAVTAMRMDDFAKRLENHELDARRNLREGPYKASLLDFFGRAKGLVTYAYRLTTSEVRRILSACWLAAEMGVIPEEARNIAIKLFDTFDETEMKHDETNGTNESGEERAVFLRDVLGQYMK